MTDAATKVIVAWLKEVLVPDETTHMRKGAGGLISSLAEAGLVIRPTEPTEVMVEAGGNLLEDADTLAEAVQNSIEVIEAKSELFRSDEGLVNSLEDRLRAALTAYRNKP